MFLIYVSLLSNADNYFFRGALSTHLHRKRDRPINHSNYQPGNQSSLNTNKYMAGGGDHSGFSEPNTAIRAPAPLTASTRALALFLRVRVTHKRTLYSTTTIYVGAKLTQ